MRYVALEIMLLVIPLMAQQNGGDVKDGLYAVYPQSCRDVPCHVSATKGAILFRFDDNSWHGVGVKQADGSWLVHWTLSGVVNAGSSYEEKLVVVSPTEMKGSWEYLGTTFDTRYLFRKKE